MAGDGSSNASGQRDRRAYRSASPENGRSIRDQAPAYGERSRIHADRGQFMSLLQANLRTRLTVLYASLLGAALLLYASGVSIFFLHNLQEQLDLSLHRDVETVEGALSADRNGGLQISSREGEADEDDLDRGYLL